MNKKIKIIEIFKLIAKGEQAPKKIKSEDKEFYFQEDEASIDYLYRTDKNGNGWLVVQDLALNDEVEILEDNTEEIEELDRNLKFDDLITPYGKNEDMMWTEIIKQHNKIDEIIKYIKRKDKNND